MKKIYMPIIATVIIGLVGFIWADTQEDISKKANNETIMQYIQHTDKQRDEDREERKEELEIQRELKKEEQQIQRNINQQMLQSIQMKDIHLFLNWVLNIHHQKICYFV